MKTEQELRALLDFIERKFDSPSPDGGEDWDNVVHNLSPEWRTEIYTKNKAEKELLKWILDIPFDDSGKIEQPDFDHEKER
jgi:hypothetical protein